MEILPGTIFLCVSPLLCYGVQELAERLPTDCLLIGVEADPALHELAAERAKALPCAQNGTFVLERPEALRAVPEKISRLNKGQYRRVIRLDMSGGAAFLAEFYDSLFEATRNAVSQFWKNRVTLVKFGRRYAKNILQNLSLVDKAKPLPRVQKPILVLGAGESALQTILAIKREPTNAHARERFYIIAVDAVLQTLRSLSLRPNAVICEESQDIIARAFTGCRAWYDTLFVSASACPQVARLCPQKNVFYTSLYEQTGFLLQLTESGILPNPIPPLGSVGLSAVKIALSIRADERIPVLVSGLDFSYSCGQTHVSGSLHERARRIKSTRLLPFRAYGASFGADSIALSSKNGASVYTGTALLSYARLFSFIFGKEKNLFDVGSTGLALGIPQQDIADALAQEPQPIEKAEAASEGGFTPPPAVALQGEPHSVSQFLAKERTALVQLRNIFTGKTKIPDSQQNAQIERLLQNREYLYLHFPDGYRLSLSQDFLNRVRIELDYFLKIIGKASENC